MHAPCIASRVFPIVPMHHPCKTLEGLILMHMLCPASPCTSLTSRYDHTSPHLCRTRVLSVDPFAQYRDSSSCVGMESSLPHRVHHMHMHVPWSLKKYPHAPSFILGRCKGASSPCTCASPCTSLASRCDPPSLGWHLSLIGG